MNHPILSILWPALLLAGGSNPVTAQPAFSSYEQAKLHPLTSDRPAPDFFAGALLGNGAMGVVVTTRPDAIVLYFGHNNVWDICLAEDYRDQIGTAWHGDYHMNYNTQQPVWVTFSSNHLDKNLPYVDLIEKLMPS